MASINRKQYIIKFIQFLHKKECYTSYVRNLKQSNVSIKCFLDTTEPKEFVYRAFAWDKTNEDVLFWAKVNEDWEYELG